MTKTKIAMADIVVEIESDDTAEDLTDRALGIMAYLIPERVKLESAIIPGDEGDSSGHKLPGHARLEPDFIMMHE